MEKGRKEERREERDKGGCGRVHGVLGGEQGPLQDGGLQGSYCLG